MKTACLWLIGTPSLASWKPEKVLSTGSGSGLISGRLGVLGSAGADLRCLLCLKVKLEPVSCLLELVGRQVQSTMVLAVGAVEWPEMNMVTMLPEVESRVC